MSETKDLDILLTEKSAMCEETQEPSEDLRNMVVENASVLIVGAGGLGCELIKDFALIGFRRITIVDMDTIDLSNLNRQFLFRLKDVGRQKAQVAAEFIQKRMPFVKVQAFTCRMEELSEELWQNTQILVAGLDSVPARQWLNQKAHRLTQLDGNGSVLPETQRILIDGGTEGFKGQSRVIIPQKTACFECTLGSLPKQRVFQLCTIAETPRQPEHCVAQALEVLWGKAWGEVTFDGDDPTHAQWLQSEALERAETQGIQGVDYQLTLGVAKNIIPAVASTNALIAASCAMEAFKALTGCAKLMDDYQLQVGDENVNGSLFKNERVDDCSVCQPPVFILVQETTTLQDILNILKEKQGFYKPSIISEAEPLYIGLPETLEMA